MRLFTHTGNFNKNGITLIALVVTIVVLLILAGISLNLVLGNNGIVTKANLAVVKQENATVAEAMQFKVNYYNMESIEDIKTALQNDGIMDANGIVDTYTLLEQKLKTGNGSDNKDVYVIEDRHLYYYDKNGEQIDLGNLWNLKTADEEDVSDLFEVDNEGTLWLKDYSEYINYYGSYKKEWTIESLVIPNFIDGKQVKKLAFSTKGGDSIQGWYNLKKVIIPDGVIEIGDNAFAGCFNLTEIKIPSSVTSIGVFAFAQCSSLISINLPANITSVEIGTFCECSSLAKINIPSGVTSIESDAFKGCTGLTDVNIPEGITIISDGVFKGCSSLININIPNAVTRIGSYAFDGCSSLTNIKIPINVVEIDGCAFSRM